MATAQLDLAVRPTGARWTVTNDEAGMTALVARLQTGAPTLIGLEATGGAQQPVVAALAAVRLPVVVVNPRQARACAKATGQLAKTDTRDACALAQFADAVRPAPRSLPDAQMEGLRALRARRRQLIAMRTAEQNRLGRAAPRLRADLQAHITWLHERLATLDDELDTTLRGTRTVWGGRAHVRATLDMRTLVAVRYTPVLKVFDQCLRAAGKAAKVALTACMRKLLTILNAMVKHQTLWQPQEEPIASHPRDP